MIVLSVFWLLYIILYYTFDEVLWNKTGPFTFDFESPMRNLPKLLVNPYSWTKVAHMIFLDQPVNTGFSYATTDQGMESSDTIVVQQIYSFLQEVSTYTSYIYR